jgi:hypothetical protein
MTRSIREAEEREKQALATLERKRQLKEILAGLAIEAEDAMVLLHKLTDMAPGIGRNPYVQNLRTKLDGMKGKIALLQL